MTAFSIGLLISSSLFWFLLATDEWKRTDCDVETFAVAVTAFVLYAVCAVVEVVR